MDGFEELRCSSNPSSVFGFFPEALVRALVVGRDGTHELRWPDHGVDLDGGQDGRCQISRPPPLNGETASVGLHEAYERPEVRPKALNPALPSSSLFQLVLKRRLDELGQSRGMSLETACGGGLRLTNP